MRALIHEIREASGAPSISCGVLHHGQILFAHCEGYADVEQQLQPDEHTIYPVASTTKAFITTLCGILVTKGFFLELSQSQHICQTSTLFMTPRLAREPLCLICARMA